MDRAPLEPLVFPWRKLIPLELGYFVLSNTLVWLLGYDTFETQALQTSARFVVLFFYWRWIPRRRPAPLSGGPWPLAILVVACLLGGPLLLSHDPWNTGWAVLNLLSGISAGFREEFFFRAALTESLSARFGPVPAVLGGSVLFSLFHLQYFLTGNVWAIGLTFGFGIAMACLWIAFRRISWNGTIHAAYIVLLFVGFNGPLSYPECVLLTALAGVVSGGLLRSK